MVNVINPWKSGSSMGEDLFGLGGLTDAFFGPKASTSAYTREKFKEAQRQNEYTPLLAELYKQPNIDPGLAASYGINAGLEPKNVFGYRSGVNIARIPTAQIGDPASLDTITQNQLTIPGTSYVSTPGGQASAQANAQTIATMQADKAAANQAAIDARSLIPVRGADGSLTYARKSEAAGLGAPITKDQVVGGFLQSNINNLPALNPFQQDLVGANPRPGNWFLRDPGTGKIMREGRSFDGITDVDTKLPVPGGAVFQQSSNPGGANAFQAPATELGKTELKDRREAVLNADSVLDLGGRIQSIIARNPTAIGGAGNLRRMGQEGLDLINSLNTMFGGGRPGGYEAAVAETRNQLQAKLGAGALALIPELFDPDLNSVQTMNGMLLYKAAAAMGQSGRDASDKDIAAIRGYVGDPSSWTQGPGTYNTKIGTLMQIVARQRDNDHKLLQPNAGIGPRTIKVNGVDDTAAPAVTAAPAAAPVGTGTTSSGVTWTVRP